MSNLPRLVRPTPAEAAQLGQNPAYAAREMSWPELFNRAVLAAEAGEADGVAALRQMRGSPNLVLARAAADALAVLDPPGEP